MVVVLVTGGSGLLGSAIQHVIENEPMGSRFAKRLDESWIFATSADADLRSILSIDSSRNGHFDFHASGLLNRRRSFLESTNPPMSYTLLPMVRKLSPQTL
jgi:hypothetical protein